MSANNIFKNKHDTEVFMDGFVLGCNNGNNYSDLFERIINFPVYASYTVGDTWKIDMYYPFSVDNIELVSITPNSLQDYNNLSNYNIRLKTPCSLSYNGEIKCITSYSWRDFYKEEYINNSKQIFRYYYSYSLYDNPKFEWLDNGYTPCILTSETRYLKTQVIDVNGGIIKETIDSLGNSNIIHPISYQFLLASKLSIEKTRQLYIDFYNDCKKIYV